MPCAAALEVRRQRALNLPQRSRISSREAPAMYFPRRLLLVLASALLTVLLSALVRTEAWAQAQWRPTKPIELVIMAGKGGGADLIVRSMVEIIEKRKLAPVSIAPVNIAGGS